MSDWATGLLPLIVLSLPLPRNEVDMNRRSQLLSAGLISGLAKHKNVTFSDNSNLTFRGQPLQGVLFDKKHLSRWGTNILARNLRDDIMMVKNQRPRC